MGRTTSFVLSPELEKFVDEQVDSGAYASASEVLRDALTRLATERHKEEAVLRALDFGVKSGRAKPGVFKRVRSVLKKRKT